MAYIDTADVLYMPSVHEGYRKYLQKRDGLVGLLGEDLLGEIPRLDRDIRALSMPIMKNLVRVLVPSRLAIGLDNPEDLKDFASRVDKIVMPDEDVSHHVYETHIQQLGVEVEFEDYFLRWDKNWAKKQVAVVPEVVLSHDELDQHLMDLAIQEGAKSPDWWRQVGSLLVVDGKIIAQEHNRPYPVEDYSLETFGDPRSNFDSGERIDLQKCIHSEVALIAQAAKQGISTDGAEIVVSTFPCPVCARSIAEAGIKRVVFKEGYSMLDAQDIFKAKGIELVRVETEPSQPE